MATRRDLSLIKDLFETASARLHRVLIECRDFVDCIRRWDSRKTFFYLDPPYVGTTGQNGVYQPLSMERHVELAALLRKVRGKWLLSYNDCQFVRSLYRGFKQQAISVAASLPKTSSARRRELLIRNF